MTIDIVHKKSILQHCLQHSTWIHENVNTWVHKYLNHTCIHQKYLVVKFQIYIEMWFIFSTPELIKHLWQLKLLFSSIDAYISAVLLIKNEESLDWDQLQVCFQGVAWLWRLAYKILSHDVYYDLYARSASKWELESPPKW